MEKVSGEKVYLTDEVKSKSLFERIYQIGRANWLALLCALGIAILTIIVVPIVYSLEKPKGQGKNDTLEWSNNGSTFYPEINSTSNSGGIEIGSISSILFDGQDNSLFILDKNKSRILQVDFKNEKRTKIIVGNEDGLHGSNVSSLYHPNDFIYQSNILYIADTGNNRILRWKVLEGVGETVCGTTSQSLNKPMSLAMEGDSNIYIADYGNNRIVLCNILSNKMTDVIRAYPGNDDRHKYVSTPISIRYHSSTNSLVIAQEKGYNVIRWKLNSTENAWTLVAGSASSELSGTSRTLFHELCHISIYSTVTDPTLNTYVADCNNQRIQRYKGDLTKGKTIAGVIEASGNTTSLLNHPTAIAFDLASNLYIADDNNRRVQRFQRIL